VAAGLVILFLLAVILVLQMRRLSRTLGSVAKNLERNAEPVLDRARSVAENVDFIAASVRTDIQKLNESVGRITDRLNHASDRVEERVEDFNALIEVVQGEAEDIFLDTASTVRGVRAGARVLGHGEEDEDPEDVANEDEAEGKEG
jgi:methyl-accepting chemotaxis protein